LPRDTGIFSSTADEVVLSPSTIDQARFESEVREAVMELETACPDLFRSLINGGEEHTFILGRSDFAIGNTTAREWVAQMLAGSDGWTSQSD
jgi:hypothetical protein